MPVQPTSFDPTLAAARIRASGSAAAQAAFDTWQAIDAAIAESHAAGLPVEDATWEAEAAAFTALWEQYQLL